MHDSNEIRKFPDGCRVVLIGSEGRSENGKHGTVIGALPNPSGRQENQWYDVRFDDYQVGRFNQRYLLQVQPNEMQEPPKENTPAA